MSTDILFDNLIITDDEDVAKQWAEDTYEIHRQKIAQDGVSNILKIDEAKFYRFLMINGWE